MDRSDRIVLKISQWFLILLAVFFSLFPELYNYPPWFSKVIDCAICSFLLLGVAAYIENFFKKAVRFDVGLEIVVDGIKRRIVAHTDTTSTLDAPIKYNRGTTLILDKPFKPNDPLIDELLRDLQEIMDWMGDNQDKGTHQYPARINGLIDKWKSKRN